MNLLLASILFMLNVTVMTLDSVLHAPLHIESFYVNPILPAFVVGPPGYSASFLNPFSGTPVITIGISSMSITPGLSLSFKIRISSITSSSFTLQFTFGVSTSTFTKFHISYLAIEYNTFDTIITTSGTSTSYTPLWASEMEWIGNAISPLGLGTGNRQWENSFSRTLTVQPYLDTNHLVICSSMLLGMEVTSTNYEYSVQTSCSCSGNGACSFRASVKNTTKLTILRVRILTIDYIMIDFNNMHYVDLWQEDYVGGVPSLIVPKGYPIKTSVAMFHGLNSITLRTNLLQTFTVNYTTDTYSAPVNYDIRMQYIIIARTDCRTKFWTADNSGKRDCIAATYGGCSLTPFNTYSLVRLSNEIKFSQSSLYLAICTYQSLDIYKFITTSYILYQSIFIKQGCKSIAANKDFSLIVVGRFLTSPNKFQLFVFNPTTHFWQSHYQRQAEFYAQVQTQSIAISQNGQTIIVVNFISSTPVSSSLQHFEYNVTSQEYDMIDEKIYLGAVLKMSLFTELSGDLRLVVLLSDGFNLTQSHKSYKSGKFSITKSQLLPATSNKFLFSQSGKVLALQCQFPDPSMLIYHFNPTNLLYQPHSQFKYDISYSNLNGVAFAIDYEGLNILLHGKDMNGMFMAAYGRSLVTDQFQKIVLRRTFSIPAYYGIVDISSKAIALVDQSASVHSMRVHSCGTVAGATEPQNGQDLLNAIVYEADITPIDLKFQNLTNQTNEIKANLSLITAQTQSLSLNATTLETSFNQSKQNITTSLQAMNTSISNVSSQVQSVSNTLQNVSQNFSNQLQSIKQENNTGTDYMTLIAVLYAIIGVYTIVLVVLMRLVWMRREQNLQSGSRVGDTGNLNITNSLKTNESQLQLDHNIHIETSPNNNISNPQPIIAHLDPPSLHPLNNSTSTIYPSLNQLNEIPKQTPFKNRKKRQRTNYKADSIDVIHINNIESLENLDENL